MVSTRPTALVAGGSRGLGAATATALARRGFDLCLAHRGHADTAAVTEAAAREGAKVTEFVTDLSVPAEAARLGETVARLPLHAVVWCAGDLSPGSLAEATERRATQAMFLNCVSPMVLVREAAGTLTRNAGAIVLCASITALAATRGRIMYGPAKAAMTGLVRALAVELAPGVRVNGILPGVFATEMTAGLHADPAALAALEARIPLGRTGDAAEFGALAAFLAADAGYVTGTLLPIDGGLLARSPVPSGDPPS